MKKPKRRLTMRHKEMLFGYAFILPVIIGIIYFFFPMLIRVVQYSFSDIEIPFGERYVLIPRGFDHFHNAFFVHPTYVRALTEAVTDILWNVPFIIFFSLFMAVLLNRQFPGRLLFRALFFLPVVLAIPGIQANMNNMADMIQAGIDGTQAVETAEEPLFNAWIIANILGNFGMPFQIIDFMVGAVARLQVVIRSSGVQMIIFLAALQAIPTSLYEVAQVEGATAYETFWKITLPMISPLILTNVVYTVVDNYIRSAPVNMAQALTGAAARNFGLSAAFSIITTIVMTTLILVSCLIISRKVFYQNSER